MQLAKKLFSLHMIIDFSHT